MVTDATEVKISTDGISSLFSALAEAKNQLVWQKENSPSDDNRDYAGQGLRALNEFRALLAGHLNVKAEDRAQKIEFTIVDTYREKA